MKDENKKRQFSISLGRLIMVVLADGIDPDDLLAVLQDKVKDELAIQKSRNAAERSYG